MAIALFYIAAALGLLTVAGAVGDLFSLFIW